MILFDQEHGNIYHFSIVISLFGNGKDFFFVFIKMLQNMCEHFLNGRISYKEGPIPLLYTISEHLDMFICPLPHFKKSFDNHIEIIYFHSVHFLLKKLGAFVIICIHKCNVLVLFSIYH